MIKKVNRNEVRQARHARVRKTVSGTSETPRLNVFRSNSNIFAQIIDDTKGVTLVSASFETRKWWKYRSSCQSRRINCEKS